MGSYSDVVCPHSSATETIRGVSYLEMEVKQQEMTKRLVILVCVYAVSFVY